MTEFTSLPLAEMMRSRKYMPRSMFCSSRESEAATVWNWWSLTTRQSPRTCTKRNSQIEDVIGQKYESTSKHPRSS